MSIPIVDLLEKSVRDLENVSKESREGKEKISLSERIDHLTAMVVNIDDRLSRLEEKIG